MSGPENAGALAAPLLAGLGLPAVVRAERLAGGRNNQVFALTLADGRELVLKRYHRHPGDARDRLGGEWAFLSYARTRGIDAVPLPLARDEAAGLALYSRLPGEKLAPGQVAAGHVEAAAAFIVALNAPPRDVAGLAPASEACFCLADHLAAVERRVGRLARLDPDAPHAAAAARLVAEILVPAWERVSASLRRFAAERPRTPLPLAERIVSPSDFGFHNVLVAGDRVGFLDFEYAGLDDPAKLVGDFYNAPEIPAPLSTFDDFVGRLAEGLGLSDGFRARARALLDAYRVKWACIILNDFLPSEAVRRGFALAGDRAGRCRAQLDKARAKLAQIGQG